MAAPQDEAKAPEHRVRVRGEQLARGVACTLITAGQGFRCEPVDGEDGVFEITVASASVRFLPVGCRPLGGKASGS